MLEVELKFPSADPLTVPAALQSLGLAMGEEQEQVDRYFNHPARDFAATDEALRLRSVGEANYITYKGPRLDVAAKTRREIELPLASGPQTAAAWCELLAALGFRHVADVRKVRRKGRLGWRGFEIEIALDRVAELGTFVELETMAEVGSLDQAQAAVCSLAERLGLAGPERRSYLELLLAARGRAAPDLRSSLT